MELTPIENLNRLSTLGDKRIKRGDATGAIKFYTQAIDMMSDLSIVDKELEGKMKCNRSRAYMMKNNHQLALSDAQCAAAAESHCYQNHLQLAKAYEGLKEYVESLKSSHQALTLLYEDRTSGDNDDVIKETFEFECSLICQVADIDNRLATSYFDKLFQWYKLNKLLVTIAEQDRYDILLGFLSLDLEYNTMQHIKKMFRCSIGPDDWSPHAWYPSQEAACIAGLESGALQLKDLSNNQRGTSALLFSVIRGVETGSTRILDYLLTTHFTTTEQVSKIMPFGGTILHNLFMATLAENKRKEAIKVIECLKRFDHVDLYMKNSEGYPVHEVPCFVAGLPRLLERCKPVKKLGKTSTRNKKAKARKAYGFTYKTLEAKQRKGTAPTNTSGASNKPGDREIQGKDETVRTSSVKSNKCHALEENGTADKAQEVVSIPCVREEEDENTSCLSSEATCTPTEKVEEISQTTKDSTETVYAANEEDQELNSSTVTEDDLKEENQRLQAQIAQLHEKIKTMENIYESKSRPTDTNESRIIKCKIVESGVKLEVALCKLPDVLCKLGAIQLQ